MLGTIGEIRIFAGTFAPRAWAFCEGQLLALSSNSALFSILGTAYGGDNRTNFALPDLRGRTAIGVGEAPGLTPRYLASKIGSENVTLSNNNLPAHTHKLNLTASLSPTCDDSSENLTNLPAGTYYAAGTKMYYDNYNTVMGYNEVEIDLSSTTINVGNTGDNQSISIMQEYIALHYIICMQGIFPSRN